MTIIIGLEHKNKVYMGGDSALSDYWSVQRKAYPKVFHVGPYLIGTCGSPRMSQLLKHNLRAAYTHELNEYSSDEEFMVSGFIEVIRKIFKDFGFSRVSDNRESGGTFLVGYNGKLWAVYSDYQISRVSDGFQTIGSGYMVATGAMEALHELRPYKRIMRALEITGRYTTFVEPPYYVEVSH